MNSAYLGLGAFAGASLAVMTAAALLWGGAAASGEPASVRSAAGVGAVTPSQPALLPNERSTRLGGNAGSDEEVERLLERLARARGDDDDERAALERTLLAFGEAAAPPLIARLKLERDPERQRLLLDRLRKLPGSAAEAYFIERAREAPERAIRTLSIDALAERKSDRALDALERIATTDPEVLKKPFLTEPRRPDDDSTELPDEVAFTPRMTAMAALASTGDARATSTLSGIVHHEPEEALRMEAARNLGQLRGDPAAVDALIDSMTDGSAYVRLAALHSLDGVNDPRLTPLLTKIANSDSDLGVRALARRLLQRLASLP